MPAAIVQPILWMGGRAAHLSRWMTSRSRAHEPIAERASRSAARVGEVKHRTTGFPAVIACALTALAGPCVAW